MWLVLLLAACDDVTSVLRSGEGTEIPQSNLPRRRAKLLVVSDRALASQSGEDASSGPPDEEDAAVSGDPSDEPDAEVAEPDVTASCPVQISLNTVSYGSGDEGQDDYAPSNVGAIWITKDDAFVRTVVAWGPNYFDQALTWIDQTRGNLVDTVTLPTRPGHMRAVEASWDCRDTMQKLVPAGTYHVNLEFTEVEAQGPVLTGSKAIEVSIGDKASQSVRAPMGFFGEIRVSAGH